MGLMDRVRRRLRKGTDSSEPRAAERRTAPARAVAPPAWKGEKQPEVFHLDPSRVLPLEVAELADLVASGTRPLVVHHWASWDEASVRALPRVVAVLAPLVESRQIRVLDLGWDRLREAPTGRIPGMAQRPARWWDGSELQAYHREHEVPWRTRFLVGSAEALRDAAPADPLVLPRLELWEGDEGRVVGLGELEAWAQEGPTRGA